MENADTVFLGKVNGAARDQHDLPDTGIFDFVHQQSVRFMVEIKPDPKAQRLFRRPEVPAGQPRVPADRRSHLSPEISDFLFVPGDDPDGSSLTDQPFDELSTNISGNAGNKNHWCSPYTLVLPNPKAGVSE